MTSTLSRSEGPWRNLGIFAVINLAVLSLWRGADWLAQRRPDVYERIVQEDGTLEMATAWAFVAAALLFAIAARVLRHDRRFLFVLGLALFCVFVAGEEISWGQRLFGFRPPDLFLEANFQQELNLHNLAGNEWIDGSALRKRALKTILLGYGVLGAFLALAPPLRRPISTLGLVFPHVALSPAFLVSWWVYVDYPWRFSGEWVELMMGLSFLGFALATWIGVRSPRHPWLRRRSAVAVACLALIGGLGALSSRLSASLASGDPRLSVNAAAELEALREDLLATSPLRRCSIHKRLYTFVVEYERDSLLSGRFAQRVAEGLPDSRAAYFLDPWNSPYWIRMRCDDDRRPTGAFVYSFGPNRRRDSGEEGASGDDLGRFIVARN